MVILVVDDEESLCELMAEVLAKDYKIIKAYNGKEALELAKSQMPDLVVSDIMMPQMSGIELLNALREDQTTQNIPVILLSAAVSQKTAGQAEAFLSKPFELDVLEHTVSEVANSRCNDNSPFQVKLAGDNDFSYS